MSNLEIRLGEESPENSHRTLIVTKGIRDSTCLETRPAVKHHSLDIEA